MMESWSDYISKLSTEEKTGRYNGEQISRDYAKYRLTCLPELIEQIISYVNEEIPGKLHRALDVGCGPGPSTRILSPYFQEVHGIDASPTQIKEAKKHPDNKYFRNVFYQVGLAEKLPFEDNSFQLITASISFHWFDREAFMKEVQRVLVPNGVLAIYSPGKRAFISDDLELLSKYKAILKEFWKTTMHPYTDNINFMDVYKQQYRDLELSELKDNRRINSEAVVSKAELQDVLNFIRTTLAYSKFCKQDPDGAESALQELTQQILNLLQPSSDAETCLITVRVRNWCLMGRAK